MVHIIDLLVLQIQIQRALEISMGVYGTMTFEKPLSAYTNKELLEYLGITATEDEVFRNYNFTEEERREHLLNQAEEFNSKHIQHH